MLQLQLRILLRSLSGGNETGNHTEVHAEVFYRHTICRCGGRNTIAALDCRVAACSWDNEGGLLLLDL